MEVKVELMTAEAAKRAVVYGLVYYGMRWIVHMAMGGGRASVPRLGIQRGTNMRVGSRTLQTTPATPYTSARVGRNGRPPMRACFHSGKRGHWKNECLTIPGMVNRGCFTCGLRGHACRTCP